MRAILIVILVTLLAACGSDMQVTATLNSTQDVQSGDSVFLAQEVVGAVVDVDQQESKTILKIELNNVGESLVMQNAAIVVNRLKADTPLEIYNKHQEEVLIQNGGELTGLNSMFQLGAWMVGDSLSAGNESLSGYVDAFQRYLQGDQFQQGKKALQDSVKQLGEEAQGMAEVLTQEVKKARNDLDLIEKQAAQAVEQVGTELVPVIDELSKSSKAISDELDKFTQNIENQTTEGKELGTTILTSLLEALERVNNSIDPQTQQGLNEPSIDSLPKTIDPLVDPAVTVPQADDVTK